MDIKEIRDGEKLTLEISGKLNTFTAPILQDALKEGLDGIQYLKIDMEKLEYISSVGLRILLGASKEMKAANGKMVITRVNDAVMEVFTITGFNDILTIE